MSDTANGTKEKYDVQTLYADLNHVHVHTHTHTLAATDISICAHAGTPNRYADVT